MGLEQRPQFLRIRNHTGNISPFPAAGDNHQGHRK